MSEILSKTQIATGQWLFLQEINWSDQNGVERSWEAVGRVHSSGAVMMIPKLSDGRLILIRQFRPPVGGYIYEFPAGLINPGESVEETAIRELKEETGYQGKVVFCSYPAYTSPGLSSEFLYIAEMFVDLREQGNLSTHFDDSENIETFLVRPSELSGFLKKAAETGDQIDSKIYAWMLGHSWMELSNK